MRKIEMIAAALALIATAAAADPYVGAGALRIEPEAKGAPEEVGGNALAGWRFGSSPIGVELGAREASGTGSGGKASLRGANVEGIFGGPLAGPISAFVGVGDEWTDARFAPVAGTATRSDRLGWNVEGGIAVHLVGRVSLRTTARFEDVRVGDRDRPAPSVGVDLILGRFP